MARINLSKLFVQTMKEEGVRYLFTLCSGPMADIYKACTEQGIRVIDVRHEQAAAHMADAWSRLTRHPGICLSTLGPGLTNCLTGIAAAYQACSPVIFLSLSSELKSEDMMSLQEIDQLALVRPITKWARRITDPSRAYEYLTTAFRESLSGRPGPVYLGIPIDIVFQEVDNPKINIAGPTKYRIETKSKGDPASIEAAIGLLAQAKRPLVVAGSGVWWAGAEKELKEFIERIKIPVFTIGRSRGIIDDDHPLCFGFASPVYNSIFQKAAEADVVMIIGRRLNFRINYGHPPLFSSEAKIIQIDIEQSEIGRNRPVNVGIVGDAKAVLKDMMDLTDLRDSWTESEWVRNLETARRVKLESLKEIEGSEQRPLHPLRVIKTLREICEPETIVVSDGGDVQMWSRAGFRVQRPGTWQEAGPLAMIGNGLPFALAAKLARPKSRVLLVSGDGSFGFSAMEFETAVRHNIPIVAVILNDKCWGLIKTFQHKKFGEIKSIACDLGLIRYDQLAQSLGGFGQLVDDPDDLKEALTRAFESEQPACINVLTSTCSYLDWVGADYLSSLRGF